MANLRILPNVVRGTAGATGRYPVSMVGLPQILAAIAQFGYVIVFVGVLLESAGIPIPGETVLIIAGLAAHHGSLDLRAVIACGVTAAVLGDQAGYWIGRRAGRPLLLRHGRRLLITPARLARAGTVRFCSRASCSCSTRSAPVR